MKRVFVTVLMVFVLLSTVSAEIIPLDVRCAEAQYDSNDVSDLIKNEPREYNCFDVSCALSAASNEERIDIYNASDPDNRIDLIGSASFLITQVGDLRNVRGTCEMPMWYTDYCSVRGAWNLHVGIARHYVVDGSLNPDDGATGEWGPLLPSVPGKIGNLNREYDVINRAGVYTCRDTLGPELKLDERFNLRTGERTVKFVFNDDETEWNGTSIVMGYSPGTDKDTLDRTKLSECRYAITTGAAPGPISDWNEVESCSGHRTYDTFDITDELPDPTAEYVIHLWANDTVGNEREERFALTTLYEANGVDENAEPEGYCPRENECLVVTEFPTKIFSSDDEALQINDFSDYITSSNEPACVKPGLGVANVYCSDDGLVERAQALFEYGISTLDGAGFVYCGDTARLAGGDAPLNQERYTPIPSEHEPENTFGCIVGDDPSFSDWQQASAIYASNNFLAVSDDLTGIHTPAEFMEPHQAPVDMPEGYLYDEDCSNDPPTTTCSLGVRFSTTGTGLSSSSNLKYHNLTGLTAISQTKPLNTPGANMIANGHDTLLSSDLSILTTRLNAYLRDIAVEQDADYVPTYTPQELSEALRTAAYRQGSGKRIVGITTSAEEFEANMPAGDNRIGQRLSVVAVIYQDFSAEERTYIDQAKNGIESHSADHVRLNVLPSPTDSAKDETYVLLVTAKDINSAHELIEQLVVRPRIE